MSREHAHLVRELIQQTGNTENFRDRLEHQNGCFSETEVIGLLPAIFEYIEKLSSPTAYVWAAGVLAYFLLVGNKAPQFDDQGEFYRYCGLGKPLPTRSASEQIRAPPCRWWGLSSEAKRFIRDLTFYDPKDCLLYTSDAPTICSV